MSLTPEERAEEVARLQEDLARFEHVIKIRSLKAQLADHEARGRYWERVEFLTPGRVAKEGGVADDGTPIQPEWHQPSVIGAGYRIVENHEVIAYVALDGKPLRHGEPSHEHRVAGEKLTTCPY